MTGTSIARFFRRLPALVLLPVLAVAAIAAAIACTAAEVATPESAPTATPEMSGQPASSQADVADFVSRQQAVSAQWDAIRDDFDQWSAGLDVCRPGAMRQALNGFAVSFNDVTEQARGLSRSETASELADLLIVAAEEEEAAFRRLRDHWQPSNVSLFEDVEAQRSAAARARQNAEDRAIELQTTFEGGLTSVAAADGEFAELFASVADDWEQLHEDYASLREDTDVLDADSASQLGERMAAIVEALEALPDPPEGVEDTIAVLGEAAQEELEAFQAAAEAASAETGQPADGEAPTATPDPAAKFDIDTVDGAVNEAKKALEAASDAIGEADEAEAEDEIDPGQGRAELQDFRTEYNSLVRAWDAFHDGYNEWRGNEGGCDRVAVLQTLDEYSLSVSQLARDVRALPSAGSLLPVYTLLTDAAAREENAIRSLRNTWQPFTLDAFRAVHQERINADGLRRQADIAVQELQNRF